MVVQRDVTLIALFAAMIFLFLCNFMSLGIVGSLFSNAMFGIFGVTAYILPVLVFGLYLYYILMVENDDAIGVKLGAILGLYLIICILTGLVGTDLASQTGYDPAAIYQASAENHTGGGILGGSIAYAMYQLLKMIGSVLILLVAAVGCIYLLVQRSILEMARDTAMDARLHRLERREEEERYREEHPEEFEEEDEEEEEPSHYAESKKRYQELRKEQQQRRQRQAEKRRQEEEAKAPRRTEIPNMWNTDLSYEEGFAPGFDYGRGKTLQGNRPMEGGFPSEAETFAAIPDDASQSTAETAEFAAAESGASDAAEQNNIPPTIIDPEEALREYRKEQERKRIQEEQQRQDEIRKERQRLQMEKEARRNSKELHEIRPEDYVDLEGVLAGGVIDEGTHRVTQQAAVAAPFVGEAGTAATALTGFDPATEQAGEALSPQEDPFAALEKAVSKNSYVSEEVSHDPAGKQMPKMPMDPEPYSNAPQIWQEAEEYEEVPDIRVLKKASDQDPMNLIQSEPEAMESEVKSTECISSEPESSEKDVVSDTISDVVSEAIPDVVSDAIPMPAGQEVPAEAPAYVQDTVESVNVPDHRRTLVPGTPAGQRPGAAVTENVLADVPVHTEREIAVSSPTPLEEASEEPLQAQKEKAPEARTEGTLPPQPAKREYVFPPMSLLHMGSGSLADSDEELRSTAQLLQTTLRNFGVNVTITDISQGPSVTRYEMLPEMGVKVSKIVSLADDIKLALAATDIRIEAPIPGKSAIGIEVPNKEATPVALRDIVDTEEFRNQKSRLAFAVGKDIAGKPVFGDIAKMPHVLIAGATGSGKSVCINTIIMSLLFHAKPEEVKLIMIDPKVVELSVYNGIPHLMIPVVTNPQKAAAALNWGVAEMETRYRAFADAKVRDIKGYNALVRQHQQAEGAGSKEAVMHFMPQLVIIVDELADLMMVAKNDVETAICRLAQLARAAGIHLIIATQRPSVDVITGLIKANMPSRIAFRVSSGVDSRTILDMNGAEKLLGKGDMLFFPQGLPKPNRVQGCFVSDDEVTDVVNFLIANNPVSEEESRRHQQEIDAMEAGNGGAVQNTGMDSSSAESDVDDLFGSAGAFIIEKNNASIGLLQRRYRIGFNRAARIMDQLCDKGVVGESVGTKARAILMTPEQFADFCDENGYYIGDH